MQLRAALVRIPAWVQDVLIAAFVTVLQVQGTVEKTQHDPTSVVRPLAELGHLGYVLLIVSGLVIALRRRLPVVVFAVTAAASLLYYAVDFPDGPGWIALFVSIYTLTAYGDGRKSLWLAGFGIAALTVGWLIASSGIEPRAAIGWVFFRIGASIMSAALGESVRTRRVIAQEALQRAELAERTAEEEARARVTHERLTIAREVHDTVAHGVAVINVQAGVMAHILDRQPERARETLLVIERTSSQVLDEMRTILGVLRADDSADAPRPSLARFDDLLDRGRASGLEIELVGPILQSEELPSAVDTAAYRILQEAITNVIRHVGPTRVAIGLRCEADELAIDVVDRGRRSAGTEPSGDLAPGRGIRGMRERCELLGGRFAAGPRADGFAIRARLPLMTREAARRG